MALTLANLKPTHGSVRKKKRLGRGNASGRGTYAGRGLKGQRSRSGGKSGLKIRGMKARLQKVPKLRGFKSPYSKKEVVNLVVLEKYFSADSVVDPQSLKKFGLIDRVEAGVKILGQGKLTKKLTIQRCQVSASAREQVEKAGGKIV